MVIVVILLSIRGWWSICADFLLFVYLHTVCVRLTSLAIALHLSFLVYWCHLLAPPYFKGYVCVKLFKLHIMYIHISIIYSKHAKQNFVLTMHWTSVHFCACIHGQHKYSISLFLCRRGIPSIKFGLNIFLFININPWFKWVIHYHNSVTDGTGGFNEFM